jgi:hypothetical protein
VILSTRQRARSLSRGAKQDVCASSRKTSVLLRAANARHARGRICRYPRKTARPSTKIPPRKLQTSLNRRALDFLEQPRAHSATTGFRRDIARSHLMVLRPRAAIPTARPSISATRRYSSSGLARTRATTPGPSREERGGEKTALSDSPVSVIAWMRLQPIGSVFVLRNFRYCAF